MPLPPLLQFLAAGRSWRPGALGTARQVVGLAPCSVSLVAGELLAVGGPAGCGKSTFAMLAAGTVPPTTGLVRWCGGPDPAAARPQVIGPRPWEYGFLTVRQALAFHADVLALRDDALPAPTRYVPLMREVGLFGMSRVRLGALGPLDQLRVTIAQALLARPRLLCIEEPFAYCGPVERRTGVSLLHRLAGRGLAIVVTGRTPEACGGQGTADRVVLLNGGVMVNAGPPRRSVLELQVTSPDDALRRLAARLPSVVRRGRRVRVPLADLSPEAVLAVCRDAGVEVRGSRVAEEAIPPRPRAAAGGLPAESLAPPPLPPGEPTP